MSSLQNKIDFALVLRVRNANPNGDPLNGNRPRTDYGGFGEITDVCLKRKFRDRLQESGHAIFVQSDDRKIDGETSLRNRAESGVNGLGKDAWNPKKSKKNETAKNACDKWFDVRAFGQVFAFGKEGDASGVEEVAKDVRAALALLADILRHLINAYGIDGLAKRDEDGKLRIVFRI